MTDQDETRGWLLRDERGNYFLIYDYQLQGVRVGDDHVGEARNVDQLHERSGYTFEEPTLTVVGHVINNTSGAKLFNCGPGD